MPEPNGENRNKTPDQNEPSLSDIVGGESKKSGVDVEISKIEGDYKKRIKALELAQEDLIGRLGIDQETMDIFERKVEAARIKADRGKGKKLELSDFRGKKQKLVFLLVQERIKVEKEHSDALERLMVSMPSEK